MKLKSGIYKITCLPTGKIYIGSATYLMSRKSQHLSQLKNRKHHNQYLQRAFNKYKEESFTFEVIERCEVEKLIEREQYWIDNLEPKFNARKIADSNIGVKRKDNVLRNKVLMKSNTHRRKAVYLIDPITFKKQEFLNAQEADKFLNLSKGCVSGACIGRRFAKGYICVYVKDYTETIALEILQERRRKSLSDCKPILRIDKEGNILEEFGSITLAAMKYSLEVTNMTKALKGKMKRCGKMYWKYKEAL